MSTTTSHFNLFKYDTTNDASTAFSITNALNNNWDKLDANCVKRLSTTAATGNTVRPVYVDSSGQIQSCSYNIPTSTGLTATTSLSENGYIKFSNSVKFQWCKGASTSVGKNSAKEVETQFPTSFSSVYGVQLSVMSVSSSCIPVFDLTISSVTYGLSNLASSGTTLFAYIFGVGY
jgi:hypothetical protein